MIRENLSGALLAGVLAVSPLSAVFAHPLGSVHETETSVLKAQWGPGEDWRNRCWWLRNRAQQLRHDIYYAPPWDRERMEQHLWRVRDRLRDECWGRG